MNVPDMNNSSGTNWELIDGLTDEAIDRSELPPLDEKFFQRAKWRMPKKQIEITLQVDQDVLDWFQSQSSTKQRINAALRIYAEAHKELVDTEIAP